MEFDLLINFIIAISLGALIGVERQRGQPKGGFAGIRTFPLISFLGALSGFLAIEFESTIMLAVIFIAIAGLVLASYVFSAKKGFFGITAEITALITYFLGFIVMFDQFRNYALIFTVVIVVILSFKTVLHDFAKQTKDVEWNDTLKFALISLVILPILPKDINLGIFPKGSFYELNIFHPQEIWLLVVFVCAISFVGYFLVKYLGGKRGTNAIGAMGGLVSSTAVTQSMASHSKAKIDGKDVSHRPLLSAVVIATLVSFMRVGVISLAIDKQLVRILFPVITLILYGTTVFMLNVRRSKGVRSELKLSSPFKLKPALILGGIYALLTFISKLSFALKLGKSGIIIASVITGFFDIDPVILTVSSLSLTGDILLKDAITSILLAVSSNQITKSFIALTSGSIKFGKAVAKILLSFVVIILIWLFLLL